MTKFSQLTLSKEQCPRTTSCHFVNATIFRLFYQFIWRPRVIHSWLSGNAQRILKQFKLELFSQMVNEVEQRRTQLTRQLVVLGRDTIDVIKDSKKKTNQSQIKSHACNSIERHWHCKTSHI